MSRDFLTLVFFIKQLLLVPLDMPRKDFEFFRISKELFVFVIDTHPWGVETPHCIHHRGVNLNLFLKKLASAKFTRESRLPRD
jgi:hypothetical protein